MLWVPSKNCCCTVLGTKSCESCDLVQNHTTFSVWEGQACRQRVQKQRLRSGWGPNKIGKLSTLDKICTHPVVNYYPFPRPNRTIVCPSFTPHQTHRSISCPQTNRVSHHRLFSRSWLEGSMNNLFRLDSGTTTLCFITQTCDH